MLMQLGTGLDYFIQGVELSREILMFPRIFAVCGQEGPEPSGGDLYAVEKRTVVPTFLFTIEGILLSWIHPKII